MLRRLRAALAIGLTWAMGWGAVAGVAFTILLLRMDPHLRSRAGWGGGMRGVFMTSLAASLIAGTLGMIGGMFFATLLGLRERKQSVDQLSVRRVALLGGAGSLGLYLAGSAAMGMLIPFTSTGIAFVTGTAFGAGLCTMLGAASAATTLRLAQRTSVGT